jgi:hypothetical protein
VANDDPGPAGTDDAGLPGVPDDPSPLGPGSPGQGTSRAVVLAAAFLLVASFLFVFTGAVFGMLGGFAAGSDGAGAGLEVPEAAASAVVALGVFVAGWGVVGIVAGAAMLVHRRWGRWLGLVVGVAGGAFTGLSLVRALAAGEPPASLLVNLALVAGYGLTVLALATGEAHFRRA